MRRFRLVRALLIAGVILGFGHGFASLAHRGRCHRRDHDRDRDRPPAASPAPAAEPAPPSAAEPPPPR